MSKRSRDDYEQRSDDPQSPPDSVLGDASLGGTDSGSDPGGPPPESGAAFTDEQQQKEQLDKQQKEQREQLEAKRAQQLQPSTAPGAPSVADVEAAQARTGGVAPGTGPAARIVKHPELEPPPAPGELRVAPSATSEDDREDWADKPSLEELEAARVIELRTVDERSGGLYAAGVLVTRDAREVLVPSIAARGQHFLAALLSDPQIQVRIVK